MKLTKEQIKAYRKYTKHQKIVGDTYTHAAHKVEQDETTQRCEKCNAPIAWQDIKFLHDCNAAFSCFARYQDALLVLNGVYQPSLFEISVPHPIEAIEKEYQIQRR